MSQSLDDTSYVDASVDSIISGYENKIGKNIATKILAASKKGTSPLFSDEELLYLKKRDEENKRNAPDAEVEVITPVPNITLKKGNTELNIGHAVTIIKKMEEKFPTGVNKEKAEEITRQVMAQEGEQKPITRNQFVKAVNFPVKNVNEEVKYSKWTGDDLWTEDDFKFIEKEEVYKEKLPEVKQQNKNAYEIRNDILKMSFEFFKWSTELKIHIDKENKIPVDGDTIKPTADSILEIAKQFYKFVENKR